MEAFCSHHEPLLAAAAAYEFECSTSSPSLSMAMAMAMEQLHESFPPSFAAEAAAVGGDNGRSRMVSTERSSTSSAQEMDGSGSSSRKNKRRSNAIVASVKGKRASRDQGDDAKVEEDAAETAGYIHVRARRGQATDSHSVAERICACACLFVLSPNLLNVFLSKKLAFLNPRMLHELGLDIGSACHPHAPQVLRSAEMRPYEEPVQWMVPATDAASLAVDSQGVVWGATGLALRMAVAAACL